MSSTGQIGNVVVLLIVVLGYMRFRQRKVRGEGFVKEGECWSFFLWCGVVIVTTFAAFLLIGANMQPTMDNLGGAIFDLILRFSLLYLVITAFTDRRRWKRTMNATIRQIHPPPSSVLCWSCKTQLPITRETAGKKIRCEQCGTRQILPK